MSASGLSAAEQRMRERGEADDAIRSFARAYQRYAAGESATISSAELDPAGEGVHELEELADADPARALAREPRRRDAGPRRAALPARRRLR